MNFESELRETVRKQEQERKRIEAEQENNYRLRFLEQKQKATEDLNEARLISSKYIDPYLRTVNTVMLKGKGTLVRPSLKIDESNHKIRYDMNTQLFYEYDKHHRFSISFSIDFINHKISRGDKALDVKDRDYDIKMRNWIQEIVSKREYYSYKEPYTDIAV